MTDLKRGEQHGDGKNASIGSGSGNQEHNRGAEFGTAEEGTRGTDRDLDRSGQSANQGHGHPREERQGQPD